MKMSHCSGHCALNKQLISSSFGLVIQTFGLKHVCKVSLKRSFFFASSCSKAADMGEAFSPTPPVGLSGFWFVSQTTTSEQHTTIDFWQQLIKVCSQKYEIDVASFCRYTLLEQVGQGMLLSQTSRSDQHTRPSGSIFGSFALGLEQSNKFRHLILTSSICGLVELWIAVDMIEGRTFQDLWKMTATIFCLSDAGWTC